MELILIRGLPGAGKSTLAAHLQRAMLGDAVVLEADQFFMVKGEYVFDRTKLRAAHFWCQEQTGSMLDRGKTVIVANTFTTKWELFPYFDIARNRCIMPTVILCQSNYKSIHNVPVETVVAMKERFEYNIDSLFTNGE